MAGSLGTLGLLLEVSLKTQPLPVAEATLRFEHSAATAIRLLNEWGGKPTPLSASAWHDGVLSLRLSGARAAVSAAIQQLGGERVDATTAAGYWFELREHRTVFFTSDAPLWRLSVKSSTPPLALAGHELIEWGGSLRWLTTTADAATVREAAQRAGGHATLFRGGDKAVGVFHPLSAPLMAIHQRLKNVFDPGAVFNRGRMYGEF